MKYLGLFLSTLVAGPVICSASTAESNWRFQVLLDNKEIGYHTYSVVVDDNRALVQSRAEMDVKFLFFNAFRYRHSDEQTWNDNCLTSIDASTTSNNQQFDVTGQSGESGLELRSDKGSVTIDRCVKTFAYWNPDILQAESLLNSQTGELVQVEVAALGKDTINYADESIMAKKFRLYSKPGSGTKPIDLTIWYAADNMRWLALESTVKGGRVLRYQPVLLPNNDVTQDTARLSTQSL